MASPDVSWALGQFRDDQRLARYKLAHSYYLGDHRLLFATARFRSVFGAMFQALADNLCPAVVDSVADRLELLAFTSTAATQNEDTSGEAARLAVSDAPAAAAMRVWQENRMDLRATEVHREALLSGDGYALVWPDDVSQEPLIWPQKSHEIAVRYSNEKPGELDLAAKMWRRPDSKLQMNLYYPDRIEKYESKSTLRSGGNELPVSYSAAHFQPVGALDVPVPDSFEPAAATVPNPFGRVPVFHFPNRRLYAYGISELLDVIPLQDALNKTICDMLVAQEFSAYRQRWVTGLEVEVDESTGRPKSPPFEHGADRIFAASDPETKFGEFQAADLTQFIEVQESFRSEIARVSGTPLHYLFITRGDFPSGEAMKSAEARFTRKLKDRQAAFGNVWEDVLAFALRITGDMDAETRLSAVWDDAAPTSEKDRAETLILKKNLGVSRSVLLRELGYTDQQIDLIMREQPGLPAQTTPTAADTRVMTGVVPPASPPGVV
jgi:hypothetical protein